MSERPSFLKQGERARLFPVLADTSREKRMASIFLAVLPQVPTLADEILASVGQRIGKRARIDTYCEVKLVAGEDVNGRPDGLIVVNTSRSTWSALVEVKIGKNGLEVDQVSRYLETARANGIDAVITISNEFVARADHSPVQVAKGLLKKTALYHWSWPWIATQCEIMEISARPEDREQAFLLAELNRFFADPSCGIERFTQMGKHWKDLCQSVANRESLKKTCGAVEDGIASWHQEEMDLSLHLSRYVGQPVSMRIERRLVDDPAERRRQDVCRLVEENALHSVFRVPDCAADIEVRADLARRTVATSMKIGAPLDKKSTKARVNWLLRMLKDDDPRLHVRAHWRGRTPPTQCALATLREAPERLQSETNENAPTAFEIFLVEELGARFAQRRSFIEDLERTVPEFYTLVGQHLRAWQAPPPRPVPARPDEEEGVEAAEAEGE